MLQLLYIKFILHRSCVAVYDSKQTVLLVQTVMLIAIVLVSPLRLTQFLFSLLVPLPLHLVAVVVAVATTTASDFLVI